MKHLKTYENKTAIDTIKISPNFFVTIKKSKKG